MTTRPLLPLAILVFALGQGDASTEAEGEHPLCVAPATVVQVLSGDDVGADNGFVPLFDGKTLQGWRQLGGKAKYVVEDGQIIGTSVPNTSNSFLCTENTYGDFILTLEYKVDNGFNSGVQIRSEYDEAKNLVFGYQVEIDPSPRAWSGGIYDEARRGWLFDLKNKPEARNAFKQNQWNRYRIECRGDSIKTWVNGVAATDLRDSKTLRGFIGLQVHNVGPKTEPLHICLRNLRIKELHAVEQ